MTDGERPRAEQFTAWLKAAMEARGIEGIRQLAKYSHVSASALSSILRGEYLPSLETIHKLAGYFRVAPERLLAMLPERGYTGPTIPSSVFLDQARGILQIPVVDQEAGAGGASRVVTEYVYLPPSLVPANHRLGAVRVAGDCMAPRIEHGDVVVIDQDASWEDGEVVVVVIDDVIMVKRIYREAGRVRLHTDSPDYTDTFSDEAVVQGLVIQIIKRP